MPVDCDFCGVAAVGRCARCSRAFCLSHKALSYVDLCMEDVPKPYTRPVNFETLETLGATAREEAPKWFAAGIAPQPRVGVRVQSRRTLFGSKSTMEPVGLDPAWPVGNFTFRDERTDTHVDLEAGVTAGGDVVPMDGRDQVRLRDNALTFQAVRTALTAISARAQRR